MGTRLDLAALLGRGAIDFDAGGAGRTLRNARVLVTGAGGSIGSDLCRRIVRGGPAALILVERHENSLHDLLTSLQDLGVETPVVATLTDVTDVPRVNALFASERPDVVFHAAAHKHVGLMQHHVCEAVRNNVTGSRVVARAAAAHGSARFVLISTDKAADPVSVMGLTKAAAESAIQWLAAEARATRFASVRLGNVLGSAGSVVPRFLEQIRRGGPLTVRDPRATRHFLLASEAVGFILRTAMLASPEYAVYVPEMGRAVRIVDLARAIVRAVAGSPDAIALTFTGLLPGEKLEETLQAHDEEVTDSPWPHVRRLGPRRLDSRTSGRLDELERAAEADDVERALELLGAFSGAGVSSRRPG